jgi:hypothetical protein
MVDHAKCRVPVACEMQGIAGLAGLEIRTAAVIGTVVYSCPRVGKSGDNLERGNPGSQTHHSRQVLLENKSKHQVMATMRHPEFPVP